MTRENNSWTSARHGIIEPHTQIFLEKFDKSELNALERVCFQLIAYKENKPYALKNAISVELRLDTVKFYKRHCFMSNEFFDENALVYPVVRRDIPERELLISATDIQEAMQQKAREDRRSTPQPGVQHQNNTANILEVDLHINELLHDSDGLRHEDTLQ